MCREKDRERERICVCTVCTCVKMREKERESERETRVPTNYLCIYALPRWRVGGLSVSLKSVSSANRSKERFQS